MPQRIVSHPVLGDLPASEQVVIDVDGEPIPARAGEPIAAALLAAGKRVLRYSPKRNEPRGIFCAIGRCTDCAMTVDGRPNVRTCITPVRDGMLVETQQGLGRQFGDTIPGGPRPQFGDTIPIRDGANWVMSPNCRAAEGAQLVVVGAGPAGLCAAIEAARAGAGVVLLDENDRPGGQLFKQIHRFFGSGEHHAGERGYEIGRKLLAEVRELNVDVRLSTVVWGAYDAEPGGPVTLGCATADGRGYWLSAERLVLATGASELAVAFPGWTLPGVMGAGAAQTLMHLHRVLPGRRVLMVGSGNVGLIVACQLMQAGARVAAIVEAAPQVGGWQVHAARVRRAGVPILTQHTILEALGADRVTGALIGRLDGTGSAIPGSERRLRVDLICLAVGLKPQTQLAGMLDLAMADEPRRGGRVPARDERMRSSDERVYAAGDVGAIAEASIAMEEGRIAGRAAADSLGHGDPAESARLIASARQRIALLSRDVPPCPGDWSSWGGGGVGTVQVSARRAETHGLSPVGGGGPRPPAIGRELRTPDSGLPLPLVECRQRIPCNPCETACPTGAIRVGPDPTALPTVDAAKCTGCLRCVRRCPGMAVFVLKPGPEPGEATLALPWEFLPLPKAGDVGRGLDRAGRPVCPARVVQVSRTRKAGDTAVVQVAVPSRLANRVRGYSS